MVMSLPTYSFLKSAVSHSGSKVSDKQEMVDLLIKGDYKLNFSKVGLKFNFDCEDSSHVKTR